MVVLPMKVLPWFENFHRLMMHKEALCFMVLAYSHGERVWNGDHAQ